MICCLTVNLYNNQLILHIQCMHALSPVPPGKAPLQEDDTVQKETFFFFWVCVFSRNKLVRVDYFDLKMCLLMPFFFLIFFKFQNSATLLAMMFSGCINILDIMVFITLSCPWILPVCDKSSIAGQELAIFKYHKGRERLSFKHLAQTTTFVSVISSKGDPLTEIGANGIFRNNTLLQTKTPLVQYDEHMMASSQHTSVCTLHTRKVTCT